MIYFFIGIGVGVLASGFLAGKGGTVVKQEAPLPLPVAKVPSVGEAAGQLDGIRERLDKNNLSSADTERAFADLITALFSGGR